LVKFKFKCYRCAEKGTDAFKTLALYQAGNFLSNMASELRGDKLKIKRKCRTSARFNLQNKVIRVMGARNVKNVVKKFVDDPAVVRRNGYFEQSWDLLYETVLDGSYLFPEGMNMTRADLVVSMKEDRRNLMKLPDEDEEIRGNNV
jgi:hypothetical protein